MKVTDHTRLFKYVERFFARHDNTDWPTVRVAARALKWKQVRVEDAAEGDPDGRMFLSAYNTNYKQKLGDHFVESTGEKP